MRAIAREELVSELFPQRELARQNVGRHESLDQVVIAAIALPSSKTEHSRHGGCLEHCAHDVRGSAEPVDQGPLAALEVERSEGALRTNPLDRLLRDVRVLGEDAPRVHGQDAAKPWKFACGDE